MIRFFTYASIVSLLFIVSTLPARAAATVCPYTWNQNLAPGATHKDVLALQKFLNSDPATLIAPSGTGSPGAETSFYGALTAKAVVKFQEKHGDAILAPLGLTKGTGALATRTRAHLNLLCAAPLTTPDPVAAAVQIQAPKADNLLTVTKGDQPPQSIAPAGAGTVPFTTIVLKAGGEDVVVKNITVERVGPGVDAIFDSVYLLDGEGGGIGDGKNFDSNHQMILGDPFTLAAHEEKTITVYGDIVFDTTEFVGQAPILQVTAINASAPIAGTFPIRGTAHVVDNTLVIGGAHSQLSHFDPGASRNMYINDKDIRFSGVRITANSPEDLLFSSITWTQNGTAGDNDVTNVTTVINGISYPTEIDERTYTATFPSPLLVKKGESLDMYVRGDFTATGSTRTARFDIDSSADIVLTGKSYGFAVVTVPEGNTATEGDSVFITSDGTVDGDEGTPFFKGSTVTINPGTIGSISK